MTDVNNIQREMDNANELILWFVQNQDKLTGFEFFNITAKYMELAEAIKPAFIRVSAMEVNK